MFVIVQLSRNDLPNWNVGDDEICVNALVPTAKGVGSCGVTFISDTGAGPTDVGTSWAFATVAIITTANKSEKNLIISFFLFVS
jgi:hypothetical protein